MSTGDRRVAVVIPVHNRRDTTLQCLRSLSRIDRHRLELRIFVVDDGSTDGTADAIRSNFPEVQVIEGDGSLHYAAGTNLGLNAALEWNPDFVLAVNDDEVFHPNFLQRLLQTADIEPRAIIGALLLLWDQPHRVFQVGFYWDTLKGGWQVPDDMTAFSVPETPFEVGGLAGNCVLIPAQAIRECGVLDEKRFPHGWGDIQYFTRLKRNGWKLLVDPKALVWCEPNTYPPPLHREPLKKVFSILLKDRRHPLNLQRQFIARWESSPSKLAALGAFFLYTTRLVAKGARYKIGPA
jgi:GT2 family glycosyltransferase